MNLRSQILQNRNQEIMVLQIHITNVYRWAIYTIFDVSEGLKHRT